MPYGRSSTDCTKEVIFGTQNQVDRSSPGRDRRKCIPWSRKKVWEGGASLCERLTEGKRGYQGGVEQGCLCRTQCICLAEVWSIWNGGMDSGKVIEVQYGRNLKFIIKVIMQAKVLIRISFWQKSVWHQGQLGMGRKKAGKVVGVTAHHRELDLPFGP